jgi:arylsulfatase A-like enzyme
MKKNHCPGVRRKRLLLVSVWFLLFAQAFAQPGMRSLVSRPNIVLILADDLGYQDVGFQGSPDIRTPHLDALAQTGVRMKSGYVSHSFCSPTRAGLLTGRYQQRFGHINNPAWNPESTAIGLPTDQITLADVLRKAGYATGVVGKWHLGAGAPFHPNRRGFDEFFGFTGGGHMYFGEEFPRLLTQRRNAKVVNMEAVSYAIPLERNGQPVETRGYLTDVLSDEAAAFVRRHKDHPFFLYLAYNAPHSPLQASEKYLQRFAHIADPKRRSYAAMISAVDDGVGQLLATLKETRLDERTLVVFFSDNGGPARVVPVSNAPLRGEKGDVYEGGARVPFVMRWTGKLKPGVYEQPVSSLDLFATAAALANAPLPKDRSLDSVNLWPYLTGKKKGEPHTYLFWHRPQTQMGSARAGKWKLVSKEGGAAELYDLDADIGETTDLAARHPARVKTMLAAYEAWRKLHAPPLFQSPN